jgi:hypothetical protein
MRRKLQGIISVNFGEPGQLIVMYLAFVKLRKNWNTVRQGIKFIDFTHMYEGKSIIVYLQ